MTTLTIYGASDDLVEIDGDIREEFYAIDCDGKVLAFSDGTLLRITYSHSGIWRIVPIARAERSQLSIEQCPEGDENNYSDRATLVGDIAVNVYTPVDDPSLAEVRSERDRLAAEVEELRAVRARYTEALT